jgi:hypothetical protein
MHPLLLVYAYASGPCRPNISTPISAEVVAFDRRLTALLRRSTLGELVKNVEITLVADLANDTTLRAQRKALGCSKSSPSPASSL